MPWITVKTTEPGHGVKTLLQTPPGTGWIPVDVNPPSYTPSLDFSNALNSGYLALLKRI
jgi:hypothetical protein